MKNKIKEALTASGLKHILLLSEGWLVGNAINSIEQGDDVKDYDVIVPSRELFQKTVAVLSYTYAMSTSSYGGLRFKVGDVYLDIWCEELSHFLLSANRITYVYNLTKNILLKNGYNL